MLLSLYFIIFNLMKQTDIIKKFLAWKMIKQGYKIREISRILNLSASTISRIKKNDSFLEYDKKAYEIYIYFEKNPFLNLKDLSKIFKMPISTIYFKLSLYDVYGFRENKKISELAHYLFKNNDLENLKKILNHFIPSKEEDYEMLLKIPDDLLPLNLLVYKFSYIYSKIFHSKTILVTTKEMIFRIRKYKSLALKKKFLLTYYSLFIPEIMFLRASGNYDEIKRIFKNHLKEFFKLPEQIKKPILLLILNSLYYDVEVYKTLFPTFSRWTKSYKNLKDSELSKLIYSILVSLGHIKKAYSLFKDEKLKFYLGNFEEFLRISDDSIYYKILKALSYFLRKNYLKFILEIKTIEIDIANREFNDDNYKLAKAFSYYIEKNLRDAKNFILQIKKPTFLAILNKDLKLIVKHRKQDLVAKYIIKGWIKRAYEIAKRYGLISNFLIYKFIKEKLT
ncbi:MAG: helix-turn-helix domain-containing protein [Candidatus Hydrothermia bacterium]|nr:helix-turn-helix domain-containing protein [Candidatus Hydrothermia bacterium]